VANNSSSSNSIRLNAPLGSSDMSTFQSISLDDWDTAAPNRQS
jgi:hypothetical protein